MSLESDRKDSAASSITAPGPHPKTHQRRKKRPSGLQRGESVSEAPTMTTGKTTNIATLESAPVAFPNSIDMLLRPRDEDLNIMPISLQSGFKFDPRQLRDLAIVRQGGNGCARSGERW